MSRMFPHIARCGPRLTPGHATDVIIGTVRQGVRTKELVNRLQPGDIALIHHPDLDEVAADGLRRSKARAVLNGATSITGRYPNLGPALLLAAGVPLFDIVLSTARPLRDGDRICVDGAGRILKDRQVIGIGRRLDESTVEQLLGRARSNLPDEVERFIDNTLAHAEREKQFVVETMPVPPLVHDMSGRYVLVVVRGHRHREDLATLSSFIADKNPVFVGVDGGADALLEAGHKPHLIVGDMDSVSDEALAAADDIIVHAYVDGAAPGMQRISRLNLSAHVMPAPGTSEDLAMLLAYEAGAELIVAVGAHSNLIDFLEKGRLGMASTFLVRVKVGARLIDARGVSRLYRPKPRLRYPVQIAVAAMIPVLIVIMLGSPMRYLLRLAWLQLRVLAGW